VLGNAPIQAPRRRAAADGAPAGGGVADQLGETRPAGSWTASPGTAGDHGGTGCPGTPAVVARIRRQRVLGG